MTPEALCAIAEQVQRLGAEPECIASLRDAFPEFHFTHCLDEDVTRAQPVWKGAEFNLYLVDGSDHCLALTMELSLATGVLIAQM